MLSHLYVSLWVLATRLDPADWTSQSLAVHNEHYAQFRDLSTEFLALLTLLSVPYYAAIKKHGIAIQYGIYCLAMYVLTGYFWEFSNWSVSLIADGMMCLEAGQKDAFC